MGDARRVLYRNKMEWGVTVKFAKSYWEIVKIRAPEHVVSFDVKLNETVGPFQFPQSRQ